MTARTAAVGIQDFREIIQHRYFYIDKTDFIKEWWENGDTVTLIARPRRFGKTLTMSMLDYFFSIRHEGENLFEHLKIWKEEDYRKIQGTYPVVFLSFAGVKANNYHEAYCDLCSLISREYRRNVFLQNSDDFLPSDKKQFDKILSGEADVSEVCMSLNLLSEYLYNYYGKKVIILLDEYDTPMQEAYVSGYWDEMADFIRRLFNYTFKTNPYLERAVMTGITRVSKESVFSDLNNLVVITTVSKMYADVFGFTEPEVFQALDEYGLREKADDVKSWYDGFRFGNSDHIYNPWSIINYLKNKEFKPYWANTSSNRLVGRLIQKSDVHTKLIMEDLLQGKSFYMSINEELVFSDLDTEKSAVWSLLLAGGYVKALHVSENRRGKLEYELALTNRESLAAFDSMATDWFSNKRLNYGDFSDALLSGDVEYMNRYLNDIAKETFSSFDTGEKPSEFKQPENFYHGFVLGLIADLRKLYRITTNRESGFGRYDVLLEPCDPKLDDGMILEFKVFHPEKEKTLEDTIKAAVWQILDKEYAVALTAAGVPKENIRIYGFAFKGKEVLIRGGELREWEAGRG